MRVLSSGLLCQQSPWILSFCARAKPCSSIPPVGQPLSAGLDGTGRCSGDSRPPARPPGATARWHLPTRLHPLLVSGLLPVCVGRPVGSAGCYGPGAVPPRTQPLQRRKLWTAGKSMAPGVAELVVNWLLPLQRVFHRNRATDGTLPIIRLKKAQPSAF